jgi:hypothetical protein
MQIENSGDRCTQESKTDNSTLSQVNLFPIDKESLENFISVASGSTTQEGNRGDRALSRYFDSTSAFEISDCSRNAQSGSARDYKELADAVVQLSETRKVQSPADGRNSDSSKGPVDETKMAIGVAKAESDRKGTAKDAGAKLQDGDDWKGKAKDAALSATEVKERELLDGLRSEAKKIAESIKKGGLDSDTADYVTRQRMWYQAKELPADPNKTMTDIMKAAFKEAGISDIKVSIVDSSSKDAPRTPWNKNCDSIMTLELRNRNHGETSKILTGLGGRANEWVRNPNSHPRPTK